MAVLSLSNMSSLSINKDKWPKVCITLKWTTIIQSVEERLHHIQVEARSNKCCLNQNT